MTQPDFNPIQFNAALTRQWQRFNLRDAREMTTTQWWRALSGALADMLAAQPAPRPRQNYAMLTICRWSF